MKFAARLFLFALFFLSTALIVCYSSLITREAFAQGEFETDYQVAYTANVDGKTNVVQEITLRNKTANYYADKFELKIGSTKVEGVEASDETGKLGTEVKFENNVTLISVKFNQKVIGIDKSLKFSLSYLSSELAVKNGQIWEVSIPRLAKSEDINNYEAKVRVPVSFGPIAFALPEPKNSFKSGTFTEFVFDKNLLTNSGISMSFGQKQVFEFKLNYYLESTNLTSQIGQISLPPDNNYQQVYIESIDPKPLDVVVDRDGNFLAKYKIASKQSIKVNVKGYVEVFSSPFRNINKALTEEERNLYTQPQRYWETDSGSIKDKAGELKTPQQIYDFVSNFLTYSDERLNQAEIQRKGAAAAYITPGDSVCMEFTDLFIAIARAAGIPAREVEGYAYTQNERLRPLSLTLNTGDILHAWPEYWDDRLGWVQIDPTWASTSGGLDYFNKLDFNHIAFVHRGQQSTFPLPAGAYKRGESDQKSVFVNFAEQLPSPTGIGEIDIEVAGKIISGIPVKVNVSLKNTGSTSVIDKDLSITTSLLKNNSTNPVNIGVLPPFSNKNLVFSLQSTNLFLNAQDTIVASFADVQTSKPVSIQPLYSIMLSRNFVAGLAITIAIVFIGLYLYRKTHKNINFVKK